MKKFVIASLAIAALAAPAFAADMPVKAPMMAPAYNWTGLYVGVQTGYAWGSSVQTATGISTDRYKIGGAEGGGTLGYNWQMQQWVVGLETDFSGSHINGTGVTSANYVCGTICATNVNAFGTFRGRLGYAWNNVLLYGTGGLAYASIQTNLNGGVVTNWRTGWTAGAGVEYGFAPQWSAKLEWIYVNISSYQWTNATNVNFTCTGINCSTDAKFSIVRVGLNYKFW